MTWLTNQFELSRGGEGANVRPMEGLRGFAVFLVFLVHYVSLVNPWIPKGSITAKMADALHTIGNCGVDLFFVLSGYLIYGSLIKRKQAYRHFILRRIERIYPAFIAVFLLYVLLSLIFRSENKIPAGASAATIYLVQNLLLLPGLFPIQPMITVAWSLSYEMFYYLAVPVAIEGLGLRQRSPLVRAVLFSFVTAFAAAYSAAYSGHIRLIMFISGILLFESMSLGRRAPRPPAVVGLLAMALGLSGMLLPIGGSAGYTLKIVVLFIAFFILCLSCFQNPTTWLARSFCWTPLRWLGNMSYSYYLLHGLSLKAAFLVLSVFLPAAVPYGPWLFWALLPLMFAFTLPPTAALFVSIERPYSLSRPEGRR